MIQETAYSAELDAATQRIQRLKDRYAWRRRTCGTTAKDVALPDAKDEDKDVASNSATETSEPAKDSSALKVLVAKCLLDPSLTIPADAASLHKRVGHLSVLREWSFSGAAYPESSLPVAQPRVANHSSSSSSVSALFCPV